MKPWQLRGTLKRKGAGWRENLISAERKGHFAFLLLTPGQSKQPWMLYIQGEDTWLSLRLRSRPWADITDMVGCVFMPGMTRAGFRFRTVSDFSVAASRSPLAVRFLSSERMNYKLIKVRFFSIQSPQHNADASSNEVVIMHITDIKRKELKSLHV